jgi:signal transduction histidine kinase
MGINSISKRLTLQITVLMVSFSLILLVANSVLLQPLYEYALKQKMLSGVEDLQEIDFTQVSSEWINDIEQLNLDHPYDITIEYQDRVLYSSSRRIGVKAPNAVKIEPIKGPIGHDIMKENTPTPMVENWYEIKNGIEVGALTNKEGQADMFIMRAFAGEDFEILLSQGIEPIRQSVLQANILLGGVTLLFLMVSIVVARLMAKKFTKPILDMQGHVKDLSHLEFKGELKIATHDELQDLSENINVLSEKLEGALNRLKKQNKQLEKDVAFQKTFISNASHELRTPLSLIKGYADEIFQGFVQNRDQEKLYMGYIAEESVKMTRLLNEILELSRLESGQMDLLYSEQSVKGLILDFLDKYKGFIEDHKLVVKTDLEEGLGYFDPLRFEQILANYIGNAGKYADTRKLVTISSKMMQDSIRITVTNSGNPIPEAVMASMWDGFYKGDESRSRDGSSYGLGLSIVKAIQDLSEQDYGCYNSHQRVSFWFDVKRV